MKTGFKVFSILAIFALMLGFVTTKDVKAADGDPICVLESGLCFTTIQEAITAASPGDTINVADGTYVLDSSVDFNKGVILNGIDYPLIQLSGGFDGFNISGDGATLRGFWIEKTDKTSQTIIRLRASNITVQDNKIWGRYVFGDGDTSRAMIINAGGFTNLLITGNTIYDLRQPAYISGTHTGTISNNFVYRTRGWVVEGGNLTFTGNTWGTGTDANIFDIALLSTIPAEYYTNIPEIAAANNNAAIEDQRPAVDTLSIVYVDASAPAGGLGTAASPYQTIAAGITRVVSGGTIHVAAGTYAEQITIAKPLTLNGADGAILDGATLPAGWTTGVKIRSGNVTFNNIDVTNYTQDGITAYDDIDMPNLHITNSKISNIQPGYWGFGIYVGYESEGFGYEPPDMTEHFDYSGLLIEGNEITNVHSSALVIQSLTGTAGSLIVRNNNIHDNTTNSGIWVDCARNLLIEDNTVDGNKWGVEFTCYAEADQTLNGTYGPKDIVLSDNIITDSTLDGIAIYEGWPGTFDISGNTLTGNTPAIHNYLAASTDASPNWWGYSSGPAIGDVVGAVAITPWCATADCSTLGYPPVHNTTQDTYFTTIQAAINAAAAGNTITVTAGEYVENVNVNKAITLTGAGRDTTTIVGTTGNATPLTFSASGATVSGFTITHEYTQAELDAWTFNNNGVIFNQGITGNTLSACTVSLNRNGIYLNNTQGNIIDGNIVTNNRTGINTTNNINNTQIINNNINNNWTLGLVYYSQGFPTDFSTVTISGNTFDNNWYTEVLIKDAGTSVGSLDLNGNTFTDSPITFSSSASTSLNEPGFTSQKPLALGGTAEQPDYQLPTIRIYNSSTTSLDLDGTTVMVGPDQTIQAAINAASDGDTILVAPGTYVESLHIVGKDIILFAPTGATIKSPALIPAESTFATPGYTNKAVVYLNNTTSTIDGFVIDGDNKGNANYRFVGVAFHNAGGTLQNSTVMNIQDDPFSGAQHGNAIYAYNSDGTARTVNVLNNTAVDFQKNGITMIGANLTAIVTGNTVTGKGPTGVTAQNGIQISGGAAATITGNSITGMDYTGSGWASSGMILASSGAVTLGGGNTFTGSMVNLYISGQTGPLAFGAENFTSTTGWHVVNYSSIDIDLSQCTFEGVEFSSADPEDILPFAGYIYDGIDDPTYGSALLKTGYQFVNDGASIQAAVDAATAGDTILVASGTYNEAITVNKPLTLTGAGDDVTIIDGTGLTSATLFKVTGPTSGVLNISGFTFMDDPVVDAAMTYLVSFSGCTDPASINFTDNTIIGSGDTENDWGLLAQNTTCPIVINNNTFDNIGGNSMMLERATGPVEIGNNIFTVPDDGGPAIWSMSYATLADQGIVDGLQWYHDNQISAKNNSIWSGIVIAPAWGSGWDVRQYGSYTNVLIENNVIEDFQSVGVQVEVDGTNSTFNGEIRNNTLTAYPSVAFSKGIRLLGPVTNTDLTGNIITQAYRGIYLSGTWGQPIYPSGINVGMNQLAGNVFGYEEVDTTLDQNISPNWWGFAVKADFLAKINGSTDFSPWCGDASCETLIYEVFPGYSIQAAIDAAEAGDTILVGPGTYNESLIINKALILKSTDGAATTILDVPDGTLTTGIKVLGTNLGEVTIDGFTVKDFTEGGIIQGMASHEGTTVHVLNNTVIPAGNYLRNGIQVSGDYSTVIGNYVQGAHLTADWSGTGILIVNASHVLVENNTVFGNGFGMDSGIGVANWNAGLTISDIIIRNNIIDIADEAFSFTNWTATSVIDGVVFENNKITNFTTGIDAYNNGTISNVDASPNWWGTINGLTAEQILLPGAVYSPWCGNAVCSFLEPVLLGEPNTTYTNWNKTYNWTAVPGSTWYILEVYNASDVMIQSKWVSSTACVGTECAYIIPNVNLGNGSYSWRIRNVINGGYGPYSEKTGFTLAVPVCYTLGLAVNPAGSGTITPDIAQNCTGGYLAGTVVQLTANPAAGYNFLSWLGAVTGSTNPVSVTMDMNKTVNANFAAGSTTGVPSGIMTSWDKSFNWTGVTDSTWYVLEVYNADLSTMLTSKWVSATTYCTGTSCSYVIPNFKLANGSYQWRVRNVTSTYGPWSSYTPFTLNIGTVGDAIIMGNPIGNITRSTWDKTYYWTGVTDSTWYILEVYTLSGTRLSSKWISALDYCTGTTCSYVVPNLNLAFGDYQWRVRNIKAGVYGPWTVVRDFSLIP